MSNQLHFRNIDDLRFYKSVMAKLQDPDNLPKECTKYEFVNALKEANMEYYNRLLNMYYSSPELQFYWNTVNDLNRDNEDFKRLAILVGATEEEVIEVFRRVAIDRLEKPWLK